MFRIRAIWQPAVPVLGGVLRYELSRRGPPRTPRVLDHEKSKPSGRASCGAAARPGSRCRHSWAAQRHPTGQPARLHWLRTCASTYVDNDAISLLVQRGPWRRANTVWWFCTFDPFNVQWGNITLNMPCSGSTGTSVRVRRRVTGATFEWGQPNAVNSTRTERRPRPDDPPRTNEGQ